MPSDDWSEPTAMISCVARGSLPGEGGGVSLSGSCVTGVITDMCGVCAGVMCVVGSWMSGRIFCSLVKKASSFRSRVLLTLD